MYLYDSNRLAIERGGCRSHDQYFVWSRQIEGELVDKGRGIGEAKRAVGNSERVVVDSSPVANPSEATPSQGSSEMVVSTGEAGSPICANMRG